MSASGILQCLLDCCRLLSPSHTLSSYKGSQGKVSNEERMSAVFPKPVCVLQGSALGKKAAVVPLKTTSLPETRIQATQDPKLAHLQAINWFHFNDVLVFL